MTEQLKKHGFQAKKSFSILKLNEYYCNFYLYFNTGLPVFLSLKKNFFILGDGSNLTKDKNLIFYIM